MSPLSALVISAPMVALVMAAVLPTTITQVEPVFATITSHAMPSPSIKCDHRWCQNGSSMCLYWAGVTGWDPFQGPIPGETHTVLGSCSSSTGTMDLVPRELQGNKAFITPAPTSTISCSHKYCDNSIQYCMYWAGVTGFDISLGPIPGMTRTSLGSCVVPIAVAPSFTPSNNAMSTLATQAGHPERY
ncbi:uncharacterized protein CTRU02_213716 [Colletotrichum truncatum]|uniref:Uncharacterized protein n=1 Tax=Colletotrichum truncatum TaxID=5467 RepID=A0ACC3YH71_COLTU|nr:uncharacterized protein CTRU02_11710 [Colletotrichum truncatum]KAF6785410.1 hypothetical protein CTRU02_11710 [Colletotrichum truncatum]